ncbi:MAG: hypothetical protein C0482_23140 [Gordonia sp.]|nr:hypothetical protein [Gordonia sp. (in: high G+C Gram-positive bacteria)]
MREFVVAIGAGTSAARRRIVGAAVAVAATAMTVAGVAPAAAEPNLVDTIGCNSPDPWGPPISNGSPLRIDIDLYNNVQFPKDGATGPVLYLSANNPRAGFLFEYNVEASVFWVNTTTGARGKVIIPARGRSASWEGSLRTGRGAVEFTVRQKIGALAFFPMVNPQYSSCGGAATV